MKRKILSNLINPEEFKELYIIKNYSTLEIAEMYNCHPNAVRRLSEKYNIIKDKKSMYLRRTQNTKKKYMEKYGVENNSQLPDWRDKVKQTCQEKYGVDNISQLQDTKDKVRHTCQEKYGTNSPMQVREFERKGKQTYRKNYGVPSPFSIPEVRETSKHTWLEKYGVDNPSKSSEVTAKKLLTWLEKYGDRDSVEFKNIQEKIKKTCLEKYGVPYPCMRDECKESSGFTISVTNLKFQDSLDTLGINTELEKVIGTKSYDIFLSDTRYLLEINPTATHNSTINIFTRKSGHAKPKDYHYQKSKLATENGYHCIHIWDWDDKDKILNLFKNRERLFARKCEIQEIPVKETDEFNNLYHLQNTCRGQKICLGLYHEDKLVSLMSFGKPRYNKNYQYELLRYTTHSDYIVLGGAEKLFKHFINTYNPESIISYCDYSKFSGQVYEKLGFKKIRHTHPTAHWVKGKIRITQAQLSKYGFDKLLGKIFGEHGKGSNNQELMLRYGFVQVYDCGQLVFEWKND